MDTIKISVIVPVYNAEKYLNRATDSILKQDSVAELILVDDGSTDSSSDICDFYAKSDERVVVIHKENGGLSTARNAGLKVATGTHISFVDADDFVDLGTYQEIKKVIFQYNPDCIDFGWKYIGDLGDVNYNHHNLQKERIIEKKIIFNDIIPPLLNLKQDKDSFIADFVWNKIYKREILCNQNVWFDESRRTWEDRVFVVDYLRYCSSYYSINKFFYNYVSVPNSLSRVYDPDFFRIIIANYNMYKGKFGNIYDFNIPYVWNYWSDAIESMIYRSLGESENREQIEQNILKTLKDEQVKEWFRNRTTEDVFKKDLSELIADGDETGALELCKKKYKQENRRKKNGLVKARVKGLLKNVIKK